jgi:hypothetical protein
MPSALARGLVQQALPLRLVLIDLSLFSFGRASSFGRKRPLRELELPLLGCFFACTICHRSLFARALHIYIGVRCEVCGEYRNRTDDLLHAMQAL